MTGGGRRRDLLEPVRLRKPTGHTGVVKLTVLANRQAVEIQAVRQTHERMVLQVMDLTAIGL